MLNDPAMPVSPATAVTATVVVLFNPELDDLASLARMASWGHNVVAVVNAYDEALGARLPADANVISSTKPM
jgi:hypothetical protein